MSVLIQCGQLSDHHGTCVFAKLFTSASGAFCQKDEGKVKFVKNMILAGYSMERPYFMERQVYHANNEMIIQVSTWNQ